MRTFEQAKAYALAQHKNPTRNWHNDCQMFARQCVGAAVFGASARLAYNSIPDEHRHGSTPPPPGSLAYYGLPGSGAGHAVFVVEGGWVWSNDILRDGKIDKVRWDDIPEVWGSRYRFRGWIDWTPSGKIDVQFPTGGSGGGTGVGGKVHKVDVSAVRYAFEYDPKDKGRLSTRDDVLLVEKALADLGLLPRTAVNGIAGLKNKAAYARFEKSQGYRPNGIPEIKSLTALGSNPRVKTKFVAVP
jgi:hypothetical protein